jgi:hypothetical protein
MSTKKQGNTSSFSLVIQGKMVAPRRSAVATQSQAVLEGFPLRHGLNVGSPLAPYLVFLLCLTLCACSRENRALTIGKLTIVDGKGRDRLRLGYDETGDMVVFEQLDSVGHIISSQQSRTDGTAMLALYAPDGVRCITLQTATDGSAHFSMGREGGSAQLRMSISAEGICSLAAVSPDGGLLEGHITPTGGSDVTMSAVAAPSIRLSVSDGSAKVALVDSNGVERASLAIIGSDLRLVFPDKLIDAEKK